MCDLEPDVVRAVVIENKRLRAEVEQLKEELEDAQAWKTPISDAYDPQGNKYKDLAEIFRPVYLAAKEWSNTDFADRDAVFFAAQKLRKVVDAATLFISILEGK